MTDKSIQPSERTILGKSEIIVPLEFHGMDYSHTYIFIPMALQERKDDVLRCVFGEQVKNYKICFVYRKSDSPSNLC